MSFTRVDLPEPETPVITVSMPSGRGTSMFFRLFACAPRTVMGLPFGQRRFSGMGIFNSRAKYRPVSKAGVVAISLGEPMATRGTPALPGGELLQDLVHRGRRIADGQRRKIGNRPARDLHCQALGPQASLAARAARHRRHVLRHPLAVAVGV